MPLRQPSFWGTGFLSDLCLEIEGFGLECGALGRLGANLDANAYWLWALVTLFRILKPQFCHLSRAFVRI